MMHSSLEGSAVHSISCARHMYFTRRGRAHGPYPLLCRLASRARSLCCAVPGFVVHESKKFKFIFGMPVCQSTLSRDILFLCLLSCICQKGALEVNPA